MTTVGTWRSLPGDWSVGPVWPAVRGRRVSDVGANLLRTLELSETPWVQLLRTNGSRLHPLYFGVYGDIVYHHGAGFRDSGLSRVDRHQMRTRAVEQSARHPARRLLTAVDRSHSRSLVGQRGGAEQRALTVDPASDPGRRPDLAGEGDRRGCPGGAARDRAAAPRAAGTSAAMSPEAPAGAGASVGRVPDFFVVGQSKSGTTALYEMLRGHPQIFMPAVKEPVFMASDLHAGLWAMVKSRPRTLEAYQALFADAGADELAGEASSVYLWSSTAAANIAAVQPRARIVAIFREPASFLRSLHLQMLQNHVETEKDFGKALSLERYRRQGQRIPRGCRWPQALLYSERVRYMEQIQRFRAMFAPEQMLLLVYDDFRRDNEGTVRSVLDFLEVDERVPIEAREANPTVRMRSRRLDDLIHTALVARGPISKGVKALTSRRMRYRAVRMRRHVVYGEPRAPDEQLMLELRRRFKAEVVALGEYLDRDLVGLWGYDGID